MFLLHFFHFFYVPLSGPWYTGQVWANIFVIPIGAALGYAWSRTKYWPLKPVEHWVRHLHTKVDSLHVKHDAHAEQLASLHQKIDELHQKHDELHKAIKSQLPS